ncbi:MAG TPA: glycine cleavage system protein GcvH [Solirubrobacteraceae bacterium]
MSADPTCPSDLLYHPEHDWARVNEDEAVFGITWFAQDQLGQLVFWDAPAVGAKVTKDEPYTELESVKAVSDVIAPLSGEVIAVNAAVVDEPELVNTSPYDDGWLVRVRITAPDEVGALLDAAAYRDLVDR